MVETATAPPRTVPAAPNTTIGRLSRCSFALSAIWKRSSSRLTVLFSLGRPRSPAAARSRGRRPASRTAPRGHEHGDEADHEPEEDDGRGGSPAEARLEPLDQRVEREARNAAARIHTSTSRNSARRSPMNGQREQPDHDLGHRDAGDIDRDARARGVPASCPRVAAGAPRETSGGGRSQWTAGRP